MKFLTVVRSYYQGNRSAFLISAISIAVSLFLAVYVLGSFNYNTKSLNLFENNFKFSDYYCGFKMLDNTNQNEFYAKVDKVSKMPGVNNVIYMRDAIMFNQNEIVTFIIYNDSMEKYNELNVWKGETPKGYTSYDSHVDFAVSYSDKDKHPLNSEKVLSFMQNGKPEVKFHCSGVIKEPNYFLAMNSWAEDLTANSFFSAEANTHRLFMKETPDLLSLLGDNSFPDYDSFLVIYNDDITKLEREDVQNLISENGAFVSSEKIIENTQKDISENIRKKLMFPLLLVVLTSFAYITIAFLAIYKNNYSFSIFQLCGASKLSLFFVSGFSIFLPCLLPLILNIGFIKLYPYLYSEKILNLGGVLIDDSLIYFLIIYFVIILMISVVIQISMLWKSSANDLRRRFMQ